MQEVTTFYNVSHTPVKTYRPSANGLVNPKIKSLSVYLDF